MSKKHPWVRMRWAYGRKPALCSSGRKEFFEMTKKYTNEAMAIMIDDIVYSAPVINEPIPGGRVQISFGSSSGQQLQKEANALKDILMGGALQAPLERQYESEVGPFLGADSIEAGSSQ